MSTRQWKLSITRGWSFITAAILLAAALSIPKTTSAISLATLSGIVDGTNEPALGSVIVTATAAGAPAVVHASTITRDDGTYKLTLPVGAYDLYFQPRNDSASAAFQPTTRLNLSLAAPQTLNVTLGLKQAVAPTAFASMYCGVMADEGRDHDMTLNIYGGYGFTPGEQVQVAFDGIHDIFSVSASPNGFLYGGSMSGIVHSSTTVVDANRTEFAPGTYSLSFTSPTSSAPLVPFTVPNHCPAFALEITPGIPGNYIVSGEPFEIAIVSSNEFDAAAQVDTDSLEFGLGLEKIYGSVTAPSCVTARDVNSDGRNDVVCDVTIAGPSGNAQWVRLNGRTHNEGSSPDGFKFMRNQTIDMGIILTIADQTSAQPQLSWNALPDAEHYEIYRNGQLIGTTAGVAYTDAITTGPGTYMYYVVPVDADSNRGETSTEVQVDVAAPLEAPTGLNAVSPTSNAPVLTWDEHPQAASYRIYRQDEFTNEKVLIGTSETNSFTDIYTPGVYLYSVEAVSSQGAASPPSQTVQVAVINTANAHSDSILAQGQTEVIPNDNSDILPGLTGGSNQKASFDFSLGATGSTVDIKRPFTFSYNAGGHTLFMNSTAIDWMTVGGTNDSQAAFQGSVDVTLDGTTTNLPFIVTVNNGAGTTPASPHNFKLTVYSDSSRTTPLYSVNKNLNKGKIKIN